jgi:hypothetical protein
MEEDDEDTIELVLTPEQIAALMHAAAPELETRAPAIPTAEPSTPAPELIPPVSAPAPVRTRFLEVQLRAIRVPALLTLTVFALSLSGVKYAAVSREQDTPLPPTPSPVAVAQTPEPAAATPPPAAEPEPVHFANPFDASEVFEFPPGTTRDEARTAVAEMLLERARSRVAPSR